MQIAFYLGIVIDSVYQLDNSAIIVGREEERKERQKKGIPGVGNIVGHVATTGDRPRR